MPDEAGDYTFAQLRRLALAHSRLPSFQRRVRLSSNLIEAFFWCSRRPQIGYSTGKDSLVCLDLAARLGLPGQAVVMFTDHYHELPGTIEQIVRTEAYYGLRIQRVARAHDTESEFYREFGVEPVASERREVDYIGEDRAEILRHYGVDGSLLGLRMEESAERRMAIAQHGAVRYSKAAELWRCDPIWNWSWRDVWAYILSRDLPYHPAYEALIDAGVHPSRARVGPLTAVRVYQYGTLTTLRRLWPEAWNRFVLDNPCVAGGA